MKNRGFTMVELLSAIIILALILLIATPAYNNVSVSIKQKNYQSKTKAIALSMQKYASTYELDVIKPYGANCTTQKCCKTYDLYSFIVANGIYSAEEEIEILTEGELEAGPKIIDPITNGKLKGCVKIEYDINNYKLISTFSKNCSDTC